MIYAPLSQLKQYRIIPYVDDIIAFMRDHDMCALPNGEMEILGRDLYLRVFTYDNPRDPKEAKFETHRVDADVHIVLRGVEKIQTVAPEFMEPVAEYNTAKDIQFFSATKDISEITLGENEFAVFFPGESHKPMCFARPLDAPIKKFCFKIRMSPTSL